jgi:hypothetical protein
VRDLLMDAQSHIELIEDELDHALNELACAGDR